MRGREAKIGDKRRSLNGYLYIRTTEGWELAHRLAAEKKLGRKLFKSERVYFKDGNKENRDPDNLIIKSAKTPNLRKREQIEDRIAKLQNELDDVNDLIEQGEL